MAGFPVIQLLHMRGQRRAVPKTAAVRSVEGRHFSWLPRHVSGSPRRRVGGADHPAAGKKERFAYGRGPSCPNAVCRGSACAAPCLGGSGTGRVLAVSTFPARADKGQGHTRAGVRRAYVTGSRKVPWGALAGRPPGAAEGSAERAPDQSPSADAMPGDCSTGSAPMQRWLQGLGATAGAGTWTRRGQRPRLRPAHEKGASRGAPLPNTVNVPRHPPAGCGWTWRHGRQ